MNLSFRQLQTFVEVMRTGSVSEAGRALGRTQPAISAMIAGLEREIGFPLFERERRRLVPRPEAYYFMEEAEFMIKRMNQSARILQEIGNLDAGKLKIACNPAASNYFLPKLVGEFTQDKADIEVSLMMRSSPVVAEWIASQQYDVGFAETPEPRSTIRTEDFSFPCVCALPEGDPLVRKSVITPNDLDDKPMAVLFKEHLISVQIRKAFEDAGARLRQRFELRTFLPALQLVAQGSCYTICESLSAVSHVRIFGDRSAVTFRPFSPGLFLNMSVMTPANRPASRLAQAFAVRLQKEISNLVSGVDEELFSIRK
ncbi:LysR substrate-binding domain-containing protein [Labrenzia sp. OB1]|uniref:LysR substrate-binding domain-containing protein n=1 Tax=Labrenzia sp. OB1 TaxID=1561204 RepID=UPI0007B28019|nr:LysR substrate-binding domain-containing protein [Labrenzia sp. OB1]KZM50871.1 LysR family transcriptional regulator [Labrenzia sp. OB1]